MERNKFRSLPAAILLIAILLSTAPLPAGAAIVGDNWQMKQRDMHNTGRSDYVVPPERMNDSFFDVFSWQKPAPDSPGWGSFGATSMPFAPGAGPGFTDLVVGTYHWPKGIQGMDMHTGALFWQGNTRGGETIGRITPAFSNDGATIYVVNDATESAEYPNGHPLMAFASDTGPGSYRHNGGDLEPWHLSKISPTVGPYDLIYLHGWYEQAHAAMDSGSELSLAWAAEFSTPTGFSDPALHEGPYDLVVIQGDRGRDIFCWDGVTGDVVWNAFASGPIDASATIDPDNGNVYVAAGVDDIWIVGLDAHGLPLWGSVDLPVFDHVPGTNNPQRAQSAGCLSHDGGTYYFQTNSNQGDGRLYAIDTSDGSVKWSYETGSLGWDIESSSPIVTANGVVIVGNNQGNTYFAIEDLGGSASLLDSFAVNPDAATNSKAVASATLSADGLLYLPLRTYWTRSNGDGDTPSAAIENLFSAFDLSEDAVASLPAPANQAAFALSNSVQLLWDEIADPGGNFDHYAIYRDTADFVDVAGMTPLATVGDIATTSYLDDTAVNGTSYWYAVTTVVAGGSEQTAVQAVGPRTPYQAHDLQVVSISRGPRFPRYCPEYTVHEITEPGGFGPYYCSAATGLGCGQDEFTQRRPDPGDPVTYTATVRNRGTATIYDTMDGVWTVDGAPHDSAAEMLFLAPNDTGTFETTLTWDDLSHEVGFELVYVDDRPENNSLAIDTRSVAFFSCIERSRLEVFREDTVNYPLAATDDFIDWLNRHMARMNELFADAGCDKRVHYDTLPVIGDGDPDPAIDNIAFAIFPYRYGAGDGSLRTSGYYRADRDVDNGLIHEWGHQLGLIDLYQLNLEPWQNEVNGEAYRIGDGMMANVADFFTQHSADAMNSWLDVAHGYFGQYLYNLPEHVKLRITDLEGRPMRFTQIRVYQRTERPGLGTVLSDQVKFSGMTDELGEWMLPNIEIDPLLVPPSHSGETLPDNPFGYLHVVGTNGLLLIEAEYDGIVNYAWLDIVEVNNAFWAGETGTYVVERQLEFADYMYALPEELTELNAEQWSGDATEGGTVTLTDDTERTVVGAASIRYDTDGGYDTWMRFPGSGNARWNMDSLTGFEFWVYAENENMGFQDNSPWIYLISENGHYEYRPTWELLNGAIDTWVHCVVPLAGSAEWDLTVHGSPDLGAVRAIEFHADTWGEGFTLWIDGFEFDLGDVPAPDLPAARLTLSQNAPNPFNPTTTITFTLPDAGPVRLAVYDSLGRRIRTLADGVHEAGRHSIAWNGRDDGGDAQASGIYFYRLEAEGRALTRKMVLLQ